MASFLEMLFGCSHKSFSFPITKRRGQRGPAAATLTGTYVVCLDCGKEFPYDWQQMKVLEGRAIQAKALQAKQAKAA
jgi:hypothetical protein